MIVQRADDLITARGATFSGDRVYRYLLWRTWAQAPHWVYVMLNPSTADARENDPTVERCERRALAGGAGVGGMVVVNLFALRSTDPRGLDAAEDPVGPRNDEAILDACLSRGRLAHLPRPALVIAAWGVHGTKDGRDAHVRRLLGAHGVRLHVLGRTRMGHPRHPLYLPASCAATPWEEGQ